MIDEVALREWVEASCAAQGVPVIITDPVVLEKIKTLLTTSK